MLNEYLSDFSLTSLVADMNLDLKSLVKPLARGAVMYILQRLGVAKHLRSSPCVSAREPYSPAIDGFRNSMFILFF